MAIFIFSFKQWELGLHLSNKDSDLQSASQWILKSRIVESSMIALIATMVVLLCIPNPGNSTQTAFDVLNVVFSIAVLFMLSYGLW